MKRTMLLNAEISMLIASMGHGDMVVVGDAGLPIPTGLGAPQRIDVAVCPGVPSLDQVLTAVLSELQVEHAYIATEALQGEEKTLPPWCASRAELDIETISHEQLKALCHKARAVIRTGECSPYANMVLVSGVTF
jgi:D-ribose pyranase